MSNDWSLKFCRKLIARGSATKYPNATPRQEQDRHHDHQRHRDPALCRTERRQDERVRLPEDERQREQQRGVARDGECRHERLRHPEGDRLSAPVRRHRRGRRRLRDRGLRELALSDDELRADGRLEVRLRGEASHRVARRAQRRRRLLLRRSAADRESRGLLEGVLAALLAVEVLRRLERLVDRLQQPVVLPVADRERRDEDADADDEPRAQLVQMLDEAEPILVTDRPNDSHTARRRSGIGARGGLVLPARLAGDDLGFGRGRVDRGLLGRSADPPNASRSSSSSLSLPVMESLNSRMPEPS